MSRADHVVLVSIDGLRPEHAQDERWPAPTLQQLAWEGAQADAVRSVFPSLTYPAHAIMVTGALPARHGIYHNEPFDPAGQTGRWHWEAAALRVPALWDVLRAEGRTSAAVSWPVSVGAAIDWNLPDIWPLDPRTDPMVPIREAARPGGLFEEVEREACGRLCGENFSIHTLRREDRVGAIGAYLFTRYRPALLLLHVIGTDHIQHEYGRANPMTRRAVGAADRAVGQVLEVVEQLGLRGRTAFIITGDHGSLDTHTEIRPNAWLAEAGLLEDRPDRGRWRACFHGSGGSVFLRLRARADRAALTRVRELLAARAAGERRLFRVIGRRRLQSLGADPEAHLALAAAPGVAFSTIAAAPALGPATGAGHGYLPGIPEMHTALVASGAGIRRGVTAATLRIENVAPLVAALLGLPFSPADGVLLPGFLQPSAAA
ncbi:MAG TPA: ectonucleotide pyrophosphatase/phosphodiesterase [Longimicrobium sp.]|nr:ectonucleotide pyrophosphatase/phosphodiesterase [Longimicrobium sp.]